LLIDQDISKLLSPLEKGIYPAQELQWVTLVAWNNGVHFYRMAQYDIAEKWMSMAISLLKYHTEKLDFESEIIASYSILLAKVKNSSSLPGSLLECVT
jgi:hypothetical protein